MLEDKLDIKDIIDDAKKQAQVSNESLYEASHIFATQFQKKSMGQLIWDYLFNNKRIDESAISLIQQFIFFGAQARRDEMKKETKMWDRKNDSR